MLSFCGPISLFSLSCRSCLALARLSFLWPLRAFTLERLQERLPFMRSLTMFSICREAFRLASSKRDFSWAEAVEFLKGSFYSSSPIAKTSRLFFRYSLGTLYFCRSRPLGLLGREALMEMISQYSSD